MPERHSKIVTLCINEDYALPCAVTVQSLLEHSAEASEWDVHLFTDKLQASTVVRLRQTIEAKGARASFHLAEYGRFKALPLKRGFSSDAYTRLFVAHAFPEADRIIYLDSDILVQRDLAELFDLDWGSAVVAAVQTIFDEIEAVFPSVRCPRLQLGTPACDFLAGAAAPN